MLISFIRAFILLFTVTLSLRLMGKRQIGQLQPSELVITILLSDIVANPMQDNDIPMLNTLVAVAVLVGTELLFSVLGLKMPKMRQVLEGNAVVLVKNGVPDQKQMKRLRYTVNDLTEALRAKDVFDLQQVALAIAETDGSLSVLLKQAYQPLCPNDVKLKTAENGMPVTVIADGKVCEQGIKMLHLTDKGLEQLLTRAGLPAEQIFFLTLDKAGNMQAVKKEI